MTPSDSASPYGREAPVEIVTYDETWPSRFAEERDVLADALGAWLAGPIEHMGSTAVPGLAAKAVLDILVPVQELAGSRPALPVAARLGYCYAPYETDLRHWFCKPSFTQRTHHLHLVPIGSPQWLRPLAFRDYLREHPDVAAEYAALKRELATRHRLDREAYTQAKRPFIDRITAVALVAAGAAGG